MKNMAKKSKMAIKKWVLGAKSGFLGCKNNELASKMERQNGAKCRYSS